MAHLRANKCLLMGAGCSVVGCEITEDDHRINVAVDVKVILGLVAGLFTAHVMNLVRGCYQKRVEGG